MMAQYDMIYTGYGLSKNMGYGTREHMQAIKTQFSTPIHRKSFNPVDQHMPRLIDIKDTRTLRVQIVASDLLKKGHTILMIHGDFNALDILTSFKGKSHGYSLLGEESKDIIEKQAKDAINQLTVKKDISSSMNISVISVEFSKEKPKINYTNL